MVGARLVGFEHGLGQERPWYHRLSGVADLAPFTAGDHVDGRRESGRWRRAALDRCFPGQVAERSIADVGQGAGCVVAALGLLEREGGSSGT